MGILEIIFLLILIFSIIANFLSIPGNFVVSFNVLWYGLATGFERYSFSFFLTILVAAILIELTEYVFLIIGARRFGTSRWGVVSAVVFGLLGSASGAFFSPVIGAIIGGFVGLVIGVFLVEGLIKKRSFTEVKQALLGTAIGKLGGLTIKTIGTIALISAVGYKMFL